MPQHSSVQRGDISQIDLDTPEVEARERSDGSRDGANNGDDFLLKVRKPRLTDPPEPPEEIIPWLQPGWQSIDGSVDVEQAVDDPTGQTDASGQRLTIRFDADPRLTGKSAACVGVRLVSWRQVKRQMPASLAALGLALM